MSDWHWAMLVGAGLVLFVPVGGFLFLLCWFKIEAHTSSGPEKVKARNDAMQICRIEVALKTAGLSSSGCEAYDVELLCSYCRANGITYDRTRGCIVWRNEGKKEQRS